MVLLVLAMLWGIVLIPPALRARSEARRVRSVDTFRRRLALLAPVPEAPLAARPSLAARPVVASRPAVALVARPVLDATAPPGGPASIRPARAAILRRRRRVIGGLLITMAVTLAAGALPALRWLWAVHLALDLGFGAYVSGLRRLRRLALERAAKVRYLPTPAAVVAAGAEVDGRLRRSASS